MTEQNNEICIGAASNEHYFPGLIAMVTSVLLNTNREIKINFHIIDGGISHDSWDFLVQSSLKINPNVQIIKHVIDLSTFDSFPRDFGGSVLTYARLLFPGLLQGNQMIYLDADVLIMKDIQDLWALDLGDAVLGVCKDPLIDTIDQDCTVFEAYGVDPKGKHFNAGILKINLNEWRKELITEKAIQYIQKHPTECKFWDQSALNIILFGKVKFIDSSNNFFAEHFNSTNKMGQPYNIHFLMSKKPWLYHHLGTSYQLFYELMNVLQIKLNDPGYLNSLESNKYKYKFPFLFLEFYRIKAILFKYIGSVKKARIATNLLHYWKEKLMERNDAKLKKENEICLNGWKSIIQILKSN